MVIGADHAALEDREEVFGGVGVLEPASGDVLFLAVVHDAVPVDLASKADIDRARAVSARDAASATVLGLDCQQTLRNAPFPSVRSPLLKPASKKQP